jgi:hypothetical protein
MMQISEEAEHFNGLKEFQTQLTNSNKGIIKAV